MAASPARLVVIAIDAASPELLTRWAMDGTMPHLRRLMGRGLTGRTRSLDGFYVASTWPSVYTGVNPARHGVHYLFQIEPGSYTYTVAKVRHEAFWHPLSRAGRRVALIDVPLSRLDGDINGMQVVDWSGIEATYGFEAYPAALREEIARRVGEYPLQEASDGLRRGEEFGTLTDRLVEGAGRKGDLAVEYLTRGGWDFFMTVFTEAHCVGHQCWHLHDPTHPAHDAALAARIGDPVRRAYAAIDAAIGRTVEAAGDARIVVFTAHGMSHWYGAQLHLPEILFRLGAAQPMRDAGPVGGVRSTVLGMARRAWHLLPLRLRRALRPEPVRVPSRHDPAPPLPSLGVDTARSRCFMVRNGNLAGAIRLNLIGREPTGVLAPGAEAEAFLEELSADLLAIVDERTGRPAVRRVIRTSELYRGGHLDNLPELLVEWDDAVPTGSVHHGNGAASRVRLHSPKIGVIDGANTYTRTGDHRIGGMYVAAGGGIPQGESREERSVMDLAPTFARILDVDLPETDGRPIPELLR